MTKTPMWVETLRQAIGDTDATLRIREGHIAELMAEVVKIKVEVESLNAERSGLALALKRHSSDLPPTDETIEDLGFELKSVWQELNRVAVVEKALQELNEPASPAQVAALLATHGRDETAEAVSAALAHLKRSERADRVGRAQWVIRPKNAESPAGAGLSVLPAPTSDERRPDVEPTGDRGDHLSGWHDNTGGSAPSIVER